MRTLRRASSVLVGWLADRRVPQALRRTVYGAYARFSGADPSEAELEPEGYPSLGAFFVRRLKPGARALDPDPRALLAPCDGTVQALGAIERGALLQAKGQSYTVAQLLALDGVDSNNADASAALEGAHCVTIYLAPRDYHRVHTPFECELRAVRWIPGERRSVAPGVLARVPRVLATNERAVLELAHPAGRAYLVMVGALNVGRIRVVGLEPGATPARPLPFARGAELARFEMGSTVVLVVPGARPLAETALAPGAKVRLGQRIAHLA